jgi:hypothetical protein
MVDGRAIASQAAYRTSIGHPPYAIRHQPSAMSHDRDRHSLATTIGNLGQRDVELAVLKRRRSL